jgi:hypothetical protein
MFPFCNCNSASKTKKKKNADKALQEAIPEPDEINRNLGVIRLNWQNSQKAGDLFHPETARVMGWEVDEQTLDIDFEQCQRGEWNDDIEKNFRAILQNFQNSNRETLTFDCGFGILYQNKCRQLCKEMKYAPCFFFSTLLLLPLVSSICQIDGKILIITSNGESLNKHFQNILRIVYEDESDNILQDKGNRFLICGVEDTKIGRVIADEKRAFETSFKNHDHFLRILCNKVAAYQSDDHSEKIVGIVVECTELNVADDLRIMYGVPVWDLVKGLTMSFAHTSTQSFTLKECKDGDYAGSSNDSNLTSSIDSEQSEHD